MMNVSIQYQSEAFQEKWKIQTTKVLLSVQSVDEWKSELSENSV